MYNISMILLLFSLTQYAAAQVQLSGNASEIILTPPLEIGYTLGGYGARMSKLAAAKRRRLAVTFVAESQFDRGVFARALA